MDYKAIKEHCKDIGAWCLDCKYKRTMNNLCGVRDENGLTPNQWGYGGKKWGEKDA